MHIAGLILASALIAAPAAAQAQPAPAAVPVVDELTVLRLVWSTMAAVQHANETGNYSVLRDLGSPAFQANNNPATLAQVFAGVRGSVDLNNTLLVPPQFEIAPTIVEGGMLRLRGRFLIRPIPTAFDLLFENVAGRWRLFGIALMPIVPGQAPPQQPQQLQPTRPRR